MTLTAAENLAPATEQADVYDFRRPTTLAREHSRALELAYETFARQWGTQLTANIRTRSQVTFQQVYMNTYDEYAASVPASTVMVLLSVGAEEERAVLQVPISAALSWFSHMLGGTGNHSEPTRILTMMEQALLRKLVDDTLDDLHYSLGPLLEAELSIDTIHHNSQFAQAAAPTALMVVASFLVQSGEQSATATLAIPADQLLRRLGDTNPVVTSTDVRGIVETQVVRVPVDVAVQLPPVSVTPSLILNLAVGDVIPLGYPNHRPLEIAVSGITLAHAAVGANGPRLACIVTDIQENER